MILAILQARVSSTRLPKKVLKPILGVPMLLREIERVKHSKLINRLIVAMSDDLTDDPLEELCKKNSIWYFRGNLNDVLDRFYQAALTCHPDHIVRLTGDCPLIDPHLIDQLIRFYIDGNFDYASNALEPTFPDGLDAEVFSFYALEKAWKEAKLPSQREHVTPFIYNKSGLFRVGSFKGSHDRSKLRWTVDEPEDFVFVENIYQELYPDRPNFLTGDILRILEKRPELLSLNRRIKRNEGYQKSLENDRKESL